MAQAREIWPGLDEANPELQGGSMSEGNGRLQVRVSREQFIDMKPEEQSGHIYDALYLMEDKIDSLVWQKWLSAIPWSITGGLIVVLVAVLK